jgi:hypothetical protein
MLQHDALTTHGYDLAFTKKLSGKSGVERPEFTRALAAFGSERAGGRSNVETYSGRRAYAIVPNKSLAMTASFGPSRSA